MGDLQAAGRSTGLCPILLLLRIPHLLVLLRLFLEVLRHIVGAFVAFHIDGVHTCHAVVRAFALRVVMFLFHLVHKVGIAYECVTYLHEVEALGQCGLGVLAAHHATHIDQWHLQCLAELLSGVEEEELFKWHGRNHQVSYEAQC